MRESFSVTGVGEDPAEGVGFEIPGLGVENVDDHDRNRPVGVGSQPDEVGDRVHGVEFDGVKPDGVHPELDADEQRRETVEGIETPIGDRAEQGRGRRKRSR